ncbi:MAG: DUF4404 family protein [Gammaproteobacteria bacterium]|nr:MAG: DUF4404 family protein [Gammaproteobacteria bacterium]
MKNEELHSQLEQLHKELEQAKTLAPADRDVLGNLMSDMVKIAQGEEPVEKPRQSLREKLEEKESEFEVEHPRLAGVIRQILDALNRMGI